MANYKLPPLKVIVVALYFSWTNKVELLRTIGLPTFAMVIIWALMAAFEKKMSVGILWLIFLVFGLGFSFFAVACHRLILVESGDRHRFFREMPGYRELKFLGWVVVIYSITTILNIPLVTMVANIVGKTAVSQQGQIVGWVKEIASIPALYVLARFSLIFPAAAIDNRVTMKWAWNRTRGNGWWILLVVGLFPWLIENAIWLLLRKEASSVEWALLAIFVYIGLAVGIIALSFTYREFEKQQ